MRCDCQLRFYLFAAVLLFASVASAIDAANETQREEEMVVSEKPVLAVDDDPGQPDEAESVLVSLLTIALSGIGDKTFLLAAILSMKHSRAVVFTGAFSSLALMAILSCWLGNLVPRNYTDLFAAILFFTSGLRMLWECWRQYRERKQQDMSSGCTDEEKQRVSATAAAAEDVQQQQACTVTQENDLQIFLQTFALTFLGEWGDKSQISTIALAASNDIKWVATGIIIGHAVCTGMAVLGGRILASAISVQTVTLFGAMLFLTFGSMSTFQHIFSTRGN